MRALPRNRPKTLTPTHNQFGLFYELITTWASLEAYPRRPWCVAIMYSRQLCAYRNYFRLIPSAPLHVYDPQFSMVISPSKHISPIYYILIPYPPCYNRFILFKFLYMIIGILCTLIYTDLSRFLDILISISHSLFWHRAVLDGQWCMG